MPYRDSYLSSIEGEVEDAKKELRIGPMHGQYTMATFLDKVRHGSGTCFNPLLEERRGWIADEAPRRDEENYKGFAQSVSRGELAIPKEYHQLF